MEAARDGGACLVERSSNRAKHLGGEPDQEQYEDQDDREDHDRVKSSQGCQCDGAYVLEGAEKDVRERFRARIGCHPDTRFASMGAERDSAAGEKSNGSDGRVEVRERRSR